MLQENLNFRYAVMIYINLIVTYMKLNQLVTFLVDKSVRHPYTNLDCVVHVPCFDHTSYHCRFGFPFLSLLSGEI